MSIGTQATDSLMTSEISRSLMNEDVPEIYKLIRSEIQFENGQINSRMSWFLTSQTILAVTFAAVFREPKLSPLLMPIAVLGASLSILIFISLQAAARKIGWLRSRRERLFAVGSPLFYVGSDFASSIGVNSVNIRGLAFPLTAPLAFFVFWVYVTSVNTPRPSLDNWQNVNVRLPPSVDVRVIEKTGNEALSPGRAGKPFNETIK